MVDQHGLTIPQAATLGFVQGVTEFLPISSSIHLNLFSQALGWPEPGLPVEGGLHLGSAAGAAWMLSDLTNNPQSRVIWSFAVLPAGILGYVGDRFFAARGRSPEIAHFTLPLVGLLMAWGERYQGGTRAWQSLTWGEACLIGGVQALALFPGVSRSGATMSMGLWLGLSRPEAARFSFMIGVPIMAAAGVYTWTTSTKDVRWTPLLVGMGVAALTSYVASRAMMRYLSNGRFWPFALYRTALGVALYLVSPRDEQA